MPPMLVWRGTFCPTLMSAGELSVAMMCGVESTLASPVEARALRVTPKAGIDTPMPGMRFCEPATCWPRTPRARPVRVSALGMMLDRGLKPPSAMPSWPLSSRGSAPWKLSPRRLERLMDSSITTASMNTCRRERSSSSMTRRRAT